MDSQTSAKYTYCFGLFEADPVSGELRRQGARVKLQDQPFQILILLLERAGDIVSRDELRQRLWPSDTYVEFDGSLNAALKKLRFALGDSAENPVFIETLPKRGYRFVAPVIHREPDAQPEDAVPQSSDSDAGHASASASALPAGGNSTRPRWMRTLVFTAAFVILISGIVVSYRATRAGERNRISTANAPVTPRPSVAVLGFANASERSDDRWLSTAVSEMISTELATGERLRIVSGEEVSHLRISAPWTQTGTLGQDTTSRIGAALSGDVLVLGSYTTIPSAGSGAGSRQVRLDVRLQESATGNTLIEVAETGKVEDLFRITSVIGEKLRKRLGVAEPTQTDEVRTAASLPSNPEAARLYAMGMERLRDFDALNAKDLLEQAVKADTKFPLSHALLARAWSQLGFEKNRKQEAKLAFDLSANLPQRDRMLIEGDYYESLGNHEKAASVYRALFNLFPDSVDYGVQLSNVELAGGHPNRVADIIARLRKLPVPLSDDPRIDIAEAASFSNRQAQLVLLRRALGKAQAQGKKLLYARARKSECINMVYGDHPDQGIAACEDAYQIFWSAGNRLDAADCLRVEGDFEGSQGHLEQAIAIYERTLNILGQLGEHEKTGAVLNNEAINFASLGKLDRAEQLYRQAKQHFEQAADQGNATTATSNIGDILYARGQLAAAAESYQQTLKMAPSDVPGADSYAMYRLADLELTQGKVKQAHDHAAAAVQSQRPLQGWYQGLTGALLVLGDAQQQAGDFKGSRQSYEEALSILQKLGQAQGIAEIKEFLADLAAEEGHPEQAELLLRQAISEFEKEKAEPDASSAYTLLSKTLLASGKTKDADEAVHRALELNKKLSDPALKIQATVQNARVQIAEGAVSAGRQQLIAAIHQAQKLGYYRIEYEAKLALAEADAKSGSKAAAKDASAIVSDARSRGLELIASKAAKLQ